MLRACMQKILWHSGTRQGMKDQSKIHHFVVFENEKHVSRRLPHDMKTAGHMQAYAKYIPSNKHGEHLPTRMA